ncbi:hypothetical protein [Flagellimonas flava]|uniref:Uncharacterized protein n=1 Tax=Flagellimonas flava TaxID=570519 RepID=A0A1M5ISK6_9FLAO|nr:hypothetical protein [Allomuricauda flava]SHG31236.1 hypothetical protein SAMN04488116_0900 [Allomuricauda flava]
MQFLNKEIEFLVKQKSKKSLIKRPVSCGIFQEYEVQDKKPEDRQ